MDEEVEAFLNASLVFVPEDFTERLMREVNSAPQPALYRNRFEHLKWLALAGAIALGVFPLLTFIFSAWAMTAAY